MENYNSSQSININDLKHPKVATAASPFIKVGNFNKEEDTIMFDDLFNFAKQRTLKQSVGFFLFYAGLFMGFSGFMTLLGL